MEDRTFQFPDLKSVQERYNKAAIFANGVLTDLDKRVSWFSNQKVLNEWQQKDMLRLSNAATAIRSLITLSQQLNEARYHAQADNFQLYESTTEQHLVFVEVNKRLAKELQDTNATLKALLETFVHG